MPQRARLTVENVTDGKMFAKKMHRLVKKIQDKPVDVLDPLDLLNEMARKKGENLSIPIEVETEVQWLNLLKREGLIMVDVYSGWSGPCTSMNSILRKFKLDTNDDRMILAAANADKISQLAPFRNQSEPCWLFIGGGKPVKVLRGSNAPKLIRTIKSEFQHELDCMEGKAKRNLISIKFEASRREKAVTEAIALNELLALEEAEKEAKLNPPPKSPTPNPEEGGELEEDDGLEGKEKSPELQAEESNENPDDGEDEDKGEDNKSSAEVDEALAERKKLMEESNVRLQEALRQCTVIAIQTYLLDTGALTEIKDHLSQDFNMIRERYINLTDDDARKLFGIPAEIPDPNPPPPEPENVSDAEDNSEANDGQSCMVDDENSESQSKNISTAHTPLPPATTEDNKSEAGQGDDADGENVDGEEGDEDGRASRIKREKTPPIRMIPVPVPEVLIGDTLILLLECTRVKPRVQRIASEEDKGEGTSEEDSFDADDYMLQRTGPEEYDIAVETQPESLHAMYGKEKYVAGVWCPRTYKDKRFVMLNYFPQFVTEMLMPAIPPSPKYHIYVFSALFTSDIMEHPEYIKERTDVIGAKRTRIPHKIAEKMLIASKREGDRLRALKWALTGTEVLAISANGRNKSLIQFLDSFDPIFLTKDKFEAAFFTDKLFADAEVLIDGDPFPLRHEEETITAPSIFANLVGKVKEVVEVQEEGEENGVDVGQSGDSSIIENGNE